MDYTQKIANIEGSMKFLEYQLKNSNDAEMISRLKEKYNEYESELRRLKKLRWVAETQYVDMDDDR
jgi:hypothetical protein